MPFVTVSMPALGASRRHGSTANASGLRRRLRGLGLAVMLLLPFAVSAQLMVHPTRIVLEKNQRAQQLEVINNSNEPATYTIALVNRRMGVNGEFADAESPAAGEQFADAMLRYSPRRVTLAPGDSQVVRIMVRKPTGLAAGEYRSHLLFVKLPDPVGRNSIETPDEAARGIAVTLTALVGVSIPVIVREGATSVSVSLANLAVTASAAGHLVLSMDLQRSGNQSAYGDLVVSFAPAGRGAAQEIGRAGGLAVYTPNALRQVRLPLTLPAGLRLANGALRVSYQERPEQGGGLLAEASLSIP